MRIYTPSLDQVPGIVELWKDQLGLHNRMDPDYYKENSDEVHKEFEEYLKTALQDEKQGVFVAEDNDHLVGFVTFEICTADYLDTKLKQYGSIVELYVLPDERGKGYGKALMGAVEALMKDKGLTYISLECSSFNDNAIKFYEKHGYETRQLFMYKKLA